MNYSKPEEAMRIVGLTGGIGSGKSTVAKMLADRGAVIVDADRLAREAVAPGTPGLKAVVERFGPQYLTADGALDRRRLGRHVFDHPTELAALNAIVHPEVGRRLRAETERAAAAGAPMVVYDVPLLFENGLDALYRPVIVVSVSPAVQRARVAARDPLTEDEIEARIQAQLPLDQKVARADFVIDNDGDLEATERQVDEVFRALTGDLGSVPGKEEGS